ncbi:hypothetical protein [Solirubrobacter deserti]|uniref:Peptidoglycan-binding protein n=1 Tax=Solirubrobacter deserti TaxID=2282478 RepID=A0ABT4RNJ8_9ACTN|nr:hypothetical protein [Solirubrobacter deserti]MDA0140138.1 hypothetical protein [Solirubrobacter deserti]
MSEKGLTPEEMAAEDATALPDREAMSTLPAMPPILDLDANIDAALDLAAPVNASVAANANAALPIDAAASANVLSEGAQAGASATQTSVIGQSLEGEANATSDQVSDIEQGEPTDG